MCDPVTITALAVASAGATIAQQQHAANEQNRYQKFVYGERKEAALETFNQLREREFQERAKAAQDIRRVTSQARMAQAQAKVSALEGGAAGGSVNALLAQFERGELANVGIVENNLATTSRQLHQQAVAAGHIEGPQKAFGPLDSGIGIAAAGLQLASAGIGAYQSTQPPKPVS